MKTNEITAIPTVYRGVQLKSRLEAQCAYLFDCLNWEWEYEPFSYMVNGIHYRPDFLVRKLGLFIEVRGYLSKSGDDQIIEFCRLISDSGIDVGDRDLVSQFLVLHPACVMLMRSKFESVIFSFLVGLCDCCKEWRIMTGIHCSTCCDGSFWKSLAITMRSGKILVNGRQSEDWAAVL